MIELGYKIPKLVNPENQVIDSVTWFNNGIDDGSVCSFDNVYLELLASSYLNIDQRGGCTYFLSDSDSNYYVMKNFNKRFFLKCSFLKFF